MAKLRGRQNGQPPDFSRALVLNQWLFGLFGLQSADGYCVFRGQRRPLLEAFKLRFQINEDSQEGLDENNIHRFHHAIANQIAGGLPGLTVDQLLEFDQNIVRHTKALNARRTLRLQPPIVWKYYQYLSLLFVEIYLDRFFRDPSGLAKDLNAQIALYNERKHPSQQIEEYEEGPGAAEGLNKLALWSATGSGKTLLMHVNLLQYQHYQNQSGSGANLNRIILLTPNEGLSSQHLAEFSISGIDAELFNKSGRSLFTGSAVEIIDVHKLADQTGEKTVAVDAFETGNLVLVDEGHRGASGGEAGMWMSRRDQLCDGGFSFEYSATFKQAVRGDAELTRRYCRSIVFDYSYRYFYDDGYGKNYQIFNLDAAHAQAATARNYLVGCLLSAYQQRRLYDDLGDQTKQFNLEPPLWVFVGASVNAVRKVNKKDVSDVSDVLLFLAWFLAQPKQAMALMQSLLNGGMVTSTGRDLFHEHFRYVARLSLNVDELYKDICGRLFNSSGGGSLHVELLKGSAGEIALRLGESAPFGVINVGDAKKLWDLCASHPELICEEREFQGSLFKRINDPGTSINVLIGSRKFSEGWNSWRVSTLGLMRVGQNEGSQIIQLFGRGVRLKGWGMSLKRSRELTLPAELSRPDDLELLETLNVFGVQADYMAQFREFLKEEGLDPDAGRREIKFPASRNAIKHALKMIRMTPAINGVQATSPAAFQSLGPAPVLLPPQGEADEWLVKNKVILNWYPKIRALRSSEMVGLSAAGHTNVGSLRAIHIALLDLDRILDEVISYKRERGWHNLSVSREGLVALLNQPTWYELRVPAEVLVPDSMDKLLTWHEIAVSLLKKYLDHFFTFKKKAWQEPHLEYASLASDDPNFPHSGPGQDELAYTVLVDRKETHLIGQLETIAKEVSDGLAGPWSLPGVEVIRFENHLYEPLLMADRSGVQVQPLPLNEGEMGFVKELKAFCAQSLHQQATYALYLLRNMSRGRGLGFFEADNFHPDFIMWQVWPERQRLVFVDPKGLRNVPWEDKRLKFGETIAEIETRLGDPQVTLDSYILSITPHAEMARMWGRTPEEIRARNILFHHNTGYIQEMLSGASAGAPEA